MADNDLHPSAPLSKADLARTLSSLWGTSIGITHALHFLICDLEHGLCETRAIASDDRTVTLIFSRDSINATLWLTGEISDKVDALTKELSALEDRLTIESEAEADGAYDGNRLDRLIEAHRAAHRNWMGQVDDKGDLRAEDGKAEDRALMALLSYPARNIDDARRKAAYLVTTRYKDMLGKEALAHLYSFVSGFGKVTAAA